MELKRRPGHSAWKPQVLDPVARGGPRMPPDFILRQLAAEQKEKAVSIILSGMGSDGTQGLKAVKEDFGRRPMTVRFRILALFARTQYDARCG